MRCIRFINGVGSASAHETLHTARVTSGIAVLHLLDHYIVRLIIMYTPMYASVVSFTTSTLLCTEEEQEPRNSGLQVGDSQKSDWLQKYIRSP